MSNAAGRVLALLKYSSVLSWLPLFTHCPLLSVQLCWNGDQLQQCDSNFCGSLFLSLPSHTCLGTEPHCRVLLIAAVIRSQWQRGCPRGEPCLLLVLLTDPAVKKQQERKTPRFSNTVNENHISYGDLFGVVGRRLKFTDFNSDSLPQKSGDHTNTASRSKSSV